MAGNSQGIVVSIQAKIEGWENQIKEIQNALKNIKPGTGLSKELAKELKSVESMVSNLGKNMNQRLTSEGQITHFIDKLNDVDKIFNSIGTRMSSINFEDLNPSYITDNFKDLLAQIEAAEEELSSGMEASFQNVIANSENLQKVFSKLKIDPSSMGIEELRETLREKSESLGIEIEKTNQDIDKLTSRIRELKEESKQLNDLKIMQMTDSNMTAKNILGNTSQLGVTNGLNTQFLQELELKVKSMLENGGTKLQEKIAGKKEEINKALEELVNSKTVDEAKKRIEALEQIFSSVKAKSDFEFTQGDVSKYNAQVEALIPDENIIRTKMEAIRTALSEYSIDDKTLNKLIPNIEETLRKGNFDALPEKVAKVLREAQNVAKSEVPKITAEIQKLTEERAGKQKEVMSTAATKYNIDQGLSKYDSMIAEVRKENEQLKQRVESLEEQLKQKATEQIRGTGNKTFMSSSQGLQESTNLGKAYEAQLGRVRAAEQALGKLQGVVQRWFSIYAVVRMVSNAVRSMINTVKELDKTITNIAIVTKMDQNDLWGQMPKYTQMAREYAASISGVYEVSQLYYQQGLQMSDVMALTEQTLKMARISGLSYADATNYMTNAVRSFKMEMTDASTVVDVYSAIAAKSATSVSELANAMSKTASSAQAVGATIQSTTAMMAVMIEATRESAENIGSALKSIISRYGEMKTDPSKLVDSEGEEMSLNKVDKALRTVGISIRDAAGQFRDFDDVIMELSSKWDTIDKNTQRYIATIMAGNRQQSRFLALVSSYDRLKELTDEAANSEDASQLQFLKSLDSVDAKIQQLQTSIQALYTNSGLEKIYKGVLDFANRVITSLDNLSNTQGIFAVITKIGSTFASLTTLVTALFTTIKIKFANMQTQMTATAQAEEAKRAADRKLRELQEENDIEKKKVLWQEYQAYKTKIQETEEDKRLASELKASTRSRNAAMIVTGAGLAATTVAAGMDVNENRTGKALLTGAGGILSGIGTGMLMGGIPGLIMGVVTALPSLFESINMFVETVGEKTSRLQSAIDSTNNEMVKSKAELKSLENYREKIQALSKKKDYDAESRKEWLKLNDEIVSTYPELLSYIDEEGNKIADLGSAYDDLYKQKKQAFEADWLKNIQATLTAYSDMDFVLKDQMSDASNAVTDKRSTGFGRYFGNTLIGAGVTDADRATWAEDEMKNLNRLYQQAGKDFNKFKELVQQSYGMSFEELKTLWQSGKGTHKEARWGDAIWDIFSGGHTYEMGDKQSKAVGNYLSQLESNFEYNTTMMDKQLRAIMGDMVEFYGSELDLSEYSVLKDQATDYLGKKWEEVKQEYSDPAEAMKVFMTNTETYLKEFNEVLTDEGIFASPRKLKTANDIFSNKGNYSQNYFNEIADSTNEYYKYFTDNQRDQIQKYVQKNITNAKAALEEIINTAQENGTYTKDIPTNLIDSFTNSLSAVPFKYWDSYLNNIESVLTSGSYTKADKTQVLNSMMGLNSIIEKSSLSQDNKDTAFNLVATADYTSLEGLYKLQQGLADLGINFDIKDLTDIIIPNIETDFARMTSELTSQFKEFDKVLSKVTKGMDLSEAIELADKLGVTLNDPAFQFKNGKYYFTNIKALKEAYIKQNDELYQDLERKLETQQLLTERTIPEEIDNGRGQTIERDVNIADDMLSYSAYDWWDDASQRTEQLKTLYDLTDEEALQLSNWYDTYYKSYIDAIKTEGSGYDANTSFASYVSSELAKSKENLEHAKEEYGTYQVNSILLQNGQIEDFLTSIFDEDTTKTRIESRAKQIRANSVKDGSYHISWDAAMEQATEEFEQMRSQWFDAISTGNIDDLPEELQQYSALIYDTYHSVRSNIANAMIASINDNGSKLIKVTETNAEQLKQLKDKGWITGDITAGNYVTISAEKLQENANEFLQYVVESFDTTAEKIKALTEYHKNKYSNNKTTSLDAVLDKQTFGYEELLNYMVNNRGMELNAENIEKLPELMDSMGLAFNSAGEVIVKDWTLWIQTLEQDVADLESNPQASIEEVNEAKAKLNAAKTSQTRARNDAIKDLISNYSNITEEQQKALANSLGVDYDKVSKYFIADEFSGTSYLDIGQLKADIDSGKLKVSEATEQSLHEQINSFYDNAVSYMSTATSLMSTGTTSQGDMQNFVTKMTELFEQGYLDGLNGAESYFSYDAVTKTFKLNADAWDQYLDAERKRLADMGYETQQIQDILVKNAAEGVDINSFLKAENRGAGSTARNILKGQLQTWLTTKYSQAADNATLEFYAKKIEQGGEAAVEVVKQIKGNELTGEEITTIYNAATERINTTIEQLASKEGEIIDKNAAMVLQAVGYEITELDDGKYVIEHLPEGDWGEALSSAYLTLYTELRDKTNATTEDLNNAYAKFLSSTEFDQSRPIEALQDAMSMTYEQIGEILAQEGILLETFYSDMSWYGAEQIGAGKIRITDFTKFAERMGWDTDTEEYTSAFKEYNDSLIEYNKHIADEIKGEFETLINAKPWDEINLTRMVSEFGEDNVTKLLEGYNATIKNGILTITETDNKKRMELIRKIGQYAVDNGAMLETEFQATMDQAEKQNTMNLIASYKSMIQGYSSISMETIRQYAEATNQNYQDAINNLGLTDNGDGTYSISLANLRALLEKGRAVLGEEVYNQLMAEATAVMDSMVSEISSFASFTTVGTTSQKDMIDFTNRFNKLTKQGISRDELFEYNDALGAFVLKSDKFYEYLKAQSQELKNLGMTEDEINTYLTNEVLNLVESNIDIQGYLQAAQRGKGSKAQETLRSQIEQALTTKWYGVTPDEATIEYYVNAIENGGKEAVQAIRELKGKNTTIDDMEAALNAGMNRINQVITDLEKGVGEIVNEDTVRILQMAGWTFSALGDGQYVIESVGNMVAAYQKIYEEMEKTANHTNADLNKVYASLATALDQKNIDIRDTLTNAFDVSYDILAELINKYRPDLLLKDVLNNSEAYGLELTGFGSVNIMDFNAFADAMGWEKGSPQFLEYQSKYVDDLIEASDAHSSKALQEHAMANIDAIAKAKPGSKVNVTYLSALFDQVDETLLTKIMTWYGATLKDGILTLNKNANIHAILAAVQRVAAETEALLPEQLAELSDAIADFLSEIIGLIRSGIEGSLSNVDALDLQNWAKENGIDNLQFTQTADGLKLTADSMALVYDKMLQINSLQAKSLLPSIKNSNNNYKSLASTLREVAEFEGRTAATNPAIAEAKKKAEELYGAGGGTVPLDFELRPHLEKDGFIETVRSTSAGIEGVEVLVTPILPDGSEISDASAQAYAEKFAKGEIKLNTKLVGDDGKELKYTFKDIYMGTYESADAADAAAEAYHNYHEAIIDANEALKDLSVTEKAQSNLLQDLVREHLVTADSMNFMSTELPEGIQAVVNAWENASEGINALNDAEKDGYIGVKDFYNIVTTASSLMEAAGKDFEVAGMNASELMQAAGQHLSVVDGKLTVDLSSTGMDIVGNVGDLKNNLQSGIQELAKAQIEMLDAEIQVLEVLAAMEEIGDLDVNQNGIAFEIDDIFETQEVDGEKVRKFTKGMEDYLTNLEEYATTHENVRKALERIKLGNYTMWQLVQSKDWAKWQAAGFTEETLSQFLQTLTTMDWDVDNIQQQVADVLSGLSIGVQVQLDHGLYVFSITGNQFTFDWDNKETMGNAKEAINMWWENDGKTTQEKVEELVQEYLTGKHADGTELTTDEKWKVRMTLALASGEITLKDEGNGVWSTRYKGKEFKGEKDDVINRVGQAMGYEEEGYNFEYDAESGKVTGKITIGSKQITIDDSDPNNRKFIYNNVPYDSKEKALAAAAAEGEANASDAGASFTSKEGQVWNIYTDAETNLTYSVLQGDNPVWMYKGEAFGSYEALTEYLAFVAKSNGKEKVKVDGENKLTVNLENGLELIYEYELADDGKTKTNGGYKYLLNGEEFASDEEVAEYLKAKQQPGSVVSSDGKTVSYSFMGYHVDAQFNSTTHTVDYTMTLPDGSTITAPDENSLRAAIATHIQPEGGEVNGASSNGVNYTYTTTGKVSVKVTTDSKGKVNATVTGAETIGGKTNEEVVASVESYMTKNPAKVQANVEAENVTVGVSNATITLAEGEEVSLTIPEATGKVTQLTLTADNIKADTGTNPIDINVTTLPDLTLDANVDAAMEKINKAKQEAREAEMAIKGNNEEAIKAIENTKNYASKNAAQQAIQVSNNYVWSAIDNNVSKGSSSPIHQNIYVGTNNVWTAIDNNVAHGKNSPVTQNINKGNNAFGNVGMASGNAKASGTLMGELGPELVVSNGRYFVVGQNGPEMVNLANDAIVFNHLQTKSLLEKGSSPTRGRAITNEREAASFAHGNINGGIALASASAALAQLKTLRSMWESLLNASVKDLAGKAGGGGGGGGGGDSTKNNAWIAEVERWYNLMQKIARLEQDITHQQQLRSKISSDINKNGKAYFDSQVKELQALQEELITQEALNISRKDYFDQRREQLNTDKNNPFNQLYTFDERGQLKYNDKKTFKGADGKTKKGAFAFLSDLMATDDRGAPKYTAEEQYKALKSLGFDEYMKYDSSGAELERENGKPTDYSAAVEAFWDNVESQKDEMQELHDTIEEGNNKTLELQEQQNEILKEMRDNQMAVEDAVLKAIESQRQRAIDNLQDERDALEQSTSKYIQGLSDALAKERDMYDQNQDSEELNKMRRQLAILQRSGGSGSEIRSLQSNIKQKEQDTYFEEQQSQIDAIQEASDKQIERLDAQIDLMTETLEYQKAMGLLWADVYVQMAKSPSEIAEFIYKNDSALWADSPLKTTTAMQETLFQTDQWGALQQSNDLLTTNTADLTKDKQRTTIAEAVYGIGNQDWEVFTNAMQTVYGNEWAHQSADYKNLFGTKLSQNADLTKTREDVITAIGNLSSNLTSSLSYYSGSSSSSSSSSSKGSSGGSGSSSGGTTKKSTPGTTKSGTGTTSWVTTAYNKAKDTIKSTVSNVVSSISSALNNAAKKVNTYRVGTGKLYQSASGGYYKDLSLSTLAEEGPEAVFTAEQTKVLRNNILSNSPNSLVSLLKVYNEAYKDGINPLTNNNNAVTIENAVVNMNVSQIANDYDAQRAGEQALEEIMRIARKTSAKNSIRR